jgi:hypothetical protein
MATPSLLDPCNTFLLHQLKKYVHQNSFAHADVILQETGSDMIEISSNSGRWITQVVFFEKKSVLKLCRPSGAYTINPFKTKRVCFIQWHSSYRAVNTLCLDYNSNSVNAVQWNNRCSDIHTKHIYTV